MERWRRYVNDLGAIAVPEKLGGREFGTRVRGRQPWRHGERGGKRETATIAQSKRNSEEGNGGD